MNILDKFRYKKDDPTQLNIDLNQSNNKIYSKNKEHLSRLLSTSVKVTSEIRIPIKQKIVLST